MPLYGHAAAQAGFHAAMRGGSLHHAWLLAGPEGVGKGTFARMAAIRLLAEASGRATLPDGLGVPAEHPARSLVDAGSHPDFRLLARLPKDAEKPDQDLARNITIGQIRTLQPMFATTPSMGPRRVVIIDAVDHLERNGANALLKNLEEPPAGTVFLLVSHSPGMLLPTIRSRCRLLRFGPLDADDMAAALRAVAPDTPDEEIATLIRIGDGAPGKALRFAGLDIGAIDQAIAGIAADGDRDNARRASLARSLAGKAAQMRYEAFLDRVPALVAGIARTRHGTALLRAVDAHAAVTDIAGAARGLSLDPQATVVEIAGIVAALSE